MNHLRACFGATLLVLFAAAICAGSDKSAERLDRLIPGKYVVASIDAWSDRGSAMLNAPAWDRVQVRDAVDKLLLVIQFKDGRQSEFELKSNPSAKSWSTKEFIVSTSQSTDGSIQLRLHFCYRGFVHLNFKPETAASDAVR